MRHEIEQEVLNVLQHMEEIWGPDLPEYLQIMGRLRDEIDTRIRNATALAMEKAQTKVKVWDGAPYQCPFLFKHEDTGPDDVPCGPLFVLKHGKRTPHRTETYKDQEIPVWVSVREARMIVYLAGGDALEVG